MKKEKLIKELKYAQKSHLHFMGDLSEPYSVRRRERYVAKRKQEVIDALEGKTPITKRHISIVTRWRNIHREWIRWIEDARAENWDVDLEAVIKRQGDINWNKRWIRVYNGVLLIMSASLKNTS